MADSWNGPPGTASAPDRHRWPTVLGIAALSVVAALALCAIASFGLRVYAKVRYEFRSELGAGTVNMNFSKIDGRFPADTLTVNPDYPAGTCVHLHTTATHMQLSKAKCGASDNNYFVIQQVRQHTDCVSDTEQRYWDNNSADGGEWTACLDYYWARGNCLSIGKYEATRVRCDDRSHPNREKPLSVILNTTTNAGCPTGGFPHAVRKFTICTETQK